jgi:AcrR family transcriptional regulator
MARPRTLTDDQIAAAALAIVDRDGIAALSMRTVAQQLGTGTMSLYRYVAGREDIEKLVVERVLGAVNTRVPETATWRQRSTVLTERIREAVGMHSGVVSLVMAHRHSSQAVKRCTEALLRALTDAGFSGKPRVIALRTLVAFLNGTLVSQHHGPLPGAGTQILASMQNPDFPLMAETARDAQRVTSSEEFRKGLAVVLDGIEAMLAD